MARGAAPPARVPIVLCTRGQETFAAAREKRLAVSGNPAQYDDLAPFVEEQELFRRLRRLAAGSLLPSFEVDVSDDDVAAAAGRIASWLEETGGLHLPDGL